MPFPFTLPTTSSVSFSSRLSSGTHPSLPFAATTRRGVLRDALKKHKRLPPHSRPPDIPNVVSAIQDYLPALFALDVGLSAGKVGREEVDVVLEKELDLEWRATLKGTIAGREAPRVKLRSLEYEVFFVLSSLAYTNTLLARSQLQVLHGPATPNSDQRAAAVTAAMKHLLQACSMHTYLLKRSSELASLPPAIDISTAVFSSLASLALAEATLLAVLKDDPYPAVVAQERNDNDNEWMIKAPEIPKVRAHLFARLCLAAGEHASKASAMLGQARDVDEALLRYLVDLRRTARGKACRFFGIDADLGGKTGEAIAWLRAGMREMGFKSGDDEPKKRGFGRWKRGLDEKREDKKLEKGGDWGLDAGRLEEARVLDMLEAKWTKMNDTV
ncbi:MAG: hypothetical protein M1832_001323 [Thelocarpon impressellum]|nr:MAG: hypothetical protein M1832_001323 [Thelocarpon impressellum]